MPICSGVRGSAYPNDDLFWPSTQIGWTATPEYSFHFAKPNSTVALGVLRKHCFLDYCEHFRADPTNLSLELADGHTVNLADHRTHYGRLFALRSLGQKGKYYLVPWLTVPTTPVSGGFAPAADTGSGPNGPATFQLLVRPFSVYENKISKRTKRTIRQASDTAASPPQLTLTPSIAAVSAVWKHTSSPVIDEEDCTTSHNVLITISPATNYPDRATIDIVRTGNVVMGRICLLFLPPIAHEVVFFEVVKSPPASPSQPTTEITISMLGSTHSKAALAIQDLNRVFSKAGIRYTAIAPTLTVGQDSCNLSNSMTISSFPSGESFDIEMGLVDRVIGSIIRRFSKLVDFSVRRQYHFVFFADWVHEIKGGGSVAGVSRTGCKSSCIFVYSGETVAHEVGHASGLPHYFYESDASSLTVTGRLACNNIGVSTRRDFYDRHDSMNQGNSCVVFDTDAPASASTATLTASQNYYYLFNLDQYPKHATRNLMDYRPPQKPDDVAFDKDELVKHQIDVVRYVVGSRLIDMAGP